MVPSSMSSASIAKCPIFSSIGTESISVTHNFSSRRALLPSMDYPIPIARPNTLVMDSRVRWYHRPLIQGMGGMISEVIPRWHRYTLPLASPPIRLTMQHPCCNHLRNLRVGLLRPFLSRCSNDLNRCHLLLLRPTLEDAG